MVPRVLPSPTQGRGERCRTGAADDGRCHGPGSFPPGSFPLTRRLERPHHAGRVRSDRDPAPRGVAHHGPLRRGGEAGWGAGATPGASAPRPRPTLTVPDPFGRRRPTADFFGQPPRPRHRRGRRATTPPVPARPNGRTLRRHARRAQADRGRERAELGDDAGATRRRQPAVGVRANSAFAAATDRGSARRSIAVSASALAAASIPARASGEAAASANSREWPGTPSGEVRM